MDLLGNKTKTNLDYYKTKTVLVTGGCGFIGSHLVERLLELGSRVKIIDNLERGSLSNIEEIQHNHKIDVHLRDLRTLDPNSKLDNDLLFYDVDIVFHLAFKVGGVIYTNSREFFNEIWYDGVRINSNIIETCKRYEIQKFLFVSSACVYPNAVQTYGDPPIKESSAMPAAPGDAYGWSKLLGEKHLIWTWENKYIKEAVIIRPFNVYGPREYSDIQFGHALPVLCRKAIEYPKIPFAVHGTGRNERCFLYVSDMVEALLDAGRLLDQPIPVNIGSQESISINRLVKMIIELSGKTIKPTYINVSTTGVQARTPDLDRARERLGFQPKVSLKDGLKRTYEWIKRQLSEPTES